MTKILDACCGGRQFWFDKENANTTYMDNRFFDKTFSTGQHFVVKPDVTADFRKMPFQDGEFDMVVFDPPHFCRNGRNSWIAQKYGTLNKQTWKDDLTAGFSECFRVLKNGGFLILKWNEAEIAISQVLQCSPIRPLFGNRNESSRTLWLVFLKEEVEGND